MFNSNSTNVTVLPPSDAQSTNSDQEETIPSRKNTLINSLRPFYYFIRGVGFIPITIILDENDEVQRAVVRPFDLLWFVTAICLYTSFIIYYYFRKIHGNTLDSDGDGSKTLDIGDYLIGIFLMIMAPVMITMDMFIRPQFIDALKKFSSVDKNVSKMRSRVNLIKVKTDDLN